MPSMFDAFLNAKSKDPNWKQQVLEAKKKADERKEEKRRLLEESKIKEEQTKAKQREEEEKKKEEARLKQEQENMSNNLPFCFTYSHFGSYSRTVVIILAKDLDHAKAIANMRIDELTKELEAQGMSADYFDFKPIVKQMDLSTNYCEVFNYIE